MTNLKFAIIGCEHAHIGIFIEEMLAMGHTGIGIHEPSRSPVALALSDKYRLPLVDDQERLLREADIVGSSAINSDKIDIIERCEQFGKPIMVDKPAVTGRRDFERLQAVVDRGKIEVGMLLTERYQPTVYTLKRQIDQGVLGELVSIGTRKPHRLNAPSRPAWFFSKRQCGGIVIDLLIHDYDLLRWLTGKAVVQSEGFMGKRILPEHPEFYDTASLQVLMEGQVTAQLYADWFTPAKSWTWGDCRIFVTGTKGFAELRLSGDPFVASESLFLRTTDSESAVRVELEQPPETITGDFLRRLEAGPSLLSGRDILAATLDTIEADERVRLIRTEEGRDGI